MDTFLSTFGSRLRDERERKALNQADFGALGGVGKLAQLNYEKGTRSPSVEYLHAVSSHGVDLGYLFSGERGMDSPVGASINVELLETCIIAVKSATDRMRCEIEPYSLAFIAAYAYDVLLKMEGPYEDNLIRNVAVLAVKEKMVPFQRKSAP